MFVYKKHNIISLWIYIYWWYAAAGLRSFLINYLDLFLLQFNFVCFIFEIIHWLLIVFFFPFPLLQWVIIIILHNSMLITVGHWRALLLFSSLWAKGRLSCEQAKDPSHVSWQRICQHPFCRGWRRFPCHAVGINSNNWRKIRKEMMNLHKWISTIVQALVYFEETISVIWRQCI